MKVSASLGAIVGAAVVAVVLRYIEKREPVDVLESPPSWLCFVPARVRVLYLTRQAHKHALRG